MKVTELLDKKIFAVVNEGYDNDIEISKPFCCDLLSFAMGRAPKGAAWVTVMGNVNTIAVAELADIACVVLAEGAHLDDVAMSKAKENGICVLSTDEPIFEAAEKIMRLL
ncbi:MAG: hypothetical protein E7242_07655 [Lachnospiraceae bacterium]|nr:hypothetical protein [Lachnospiraceae bacterium]